MVITMKITQTAPPRIRSMRFIDKKYLQSPAEQKNGDVSGNGINLTYKFESINGLIWHGQR
jgi:hypothetical protein